MAYKKLWKSKRWMLIDLIGSAFLTIIFFVVMPRHYNKKYGC